ncbi:hypothetical protein T05_6530 [Trichinella murrelli]|uniref:Uncharacterized protein n=1 Tax=Trichinella murrelli TaxID=144512 RepID=A0A0V0U243_9BILA|nr:hypothetical protein T05_6530 [Trichinella murrelli]
MLVSLIPCLMAPISEENPIKMDYFYNCLICVAPVIRTVALSVTFSFNKFSVTDPRKKRFLNTSHPKKVHRAYASPDGSTKWSDLSDRVIFPCPAFTVAVLMAPSSIE